MKAENGKLINNEFVYCAREKEGEKGKMEHYRKRVHARVERLLENAG